MTRHLLALIAGAAGIAFAAIFAKLAVEYDKGAAVDMLSPVAVAFWRMLLAIPFFAAFLLRQRQVVVTKTPISWILLLPGFFFAADLGLWHWSFEYISVAKSTLEANLAAIIVPLASYFFLKERFHKIFFAGATLALGGMIVLVGPGVGQGGDAWIGDLMGLSTAFLYSGYQLLTKVLVGRYSVHLVMVVVSLVSSVFLAVFAAMSPGHFLPVTANAWYAVIALALVSQVFGQGLIAYGMTAVPVSLAAVILVLQPAAAAVLGWLILDQPLTPHQIVAGLVIILGIYLARHGTISRRPLGAEHAAIDG